MGKGEPKVDIPLPHDYRMLSEASQESQKEARDYSNKCIDHERVHSYWLWCPSRGPNQWLSSSAELSRWPHLASEPCQQWCSVSVTSLPAIPAVELILDSWLDKELSHQLTQPGSLAKDARQLQTTSYGPPGQKQVSIPPNCWERLEEETATSNAQVSMRGNEITIM